MTSNKIVTVNAGHILEASLGYFINPLINVLFGVIFFRERLRPAQWAALFMVCCGVIYLTVYYGQFPWVAMTLAVSFAIYGLLHKKHSLPPLEGFCLETMVLFIPAVLFLLLVEIKGNGSFGHVGLSQLLLQYLAPTINLLIGIFLYGESFPKERMIGFTMIWIALFLYATENMLTRIRLARDVL